MYKFVILLFFIFSVNLVKAQQIDSIFVNLYTDSLKKGTFNYINIDGRLSNGRYLPLDSSDVSFTTSHGKFFGNSLWLDPESKEEKVNIQVSLRKNNAIKENFVVYIKKAADPLRLKTEKEIMDEMRSQNKKRKGD